MAKMKNITKEELLKLAKVHTIQEIADMFNTSYTTIWKYLRKAGYRRKVGRPRLFNLTEE
jgi:DNA invertase Pin-like site-specific DNA recombinase